MSGSGCARVATNKPRTTYQSAYQRHTLLPGEDNIPPGLSPPAEETVLQQVGCS